MSVKEKEGATILPFLHPDHARQRLAEIERAMALAPGIVFALEVLDLYLRAHEALALELSPEMQPLARAMIDTLGKIKAALLLGKRACLTIPRL
jgi:hypothetical protein